MYNEIYSNHNHFCKALTYIYIYIRLAIFASLNGALTLTTRPPGLMGLNHNPDIYLFNHCIWF